MLGEPKVNRLAQARLPPVTMLGHLVQRQYAERAQPCLVGREPSRAPHQHGRQTHPHRAAATGDVSIPGCWSIREPGYHNPPQPETSQ
jgi:hypothetical protein